MKKYKTSIGVILDTDIGYDADDLFALLLLLNSPELSIGLIVTGDETRGRRAMFTRKILRLAGRADIPVMAGADLGNTNFIVDEMIVDEPEVSMPQDSITVMKEFIDSFERVIYINIQGFSNLSSLLVAYPEVLKKLTVYQMGFALDYLRHEGWVEHNVRIDVPAARHVLGAGLVLTLLMAQTTMAEGYCFSDTVPVMKRIHASTDPLLKMLSRSVMLFHEKLIKKGAPDPWSYAHDPLLASVVLGKEFVEFEYAIVTMTEHGNLVRDINGTRIRASLPTSRPQEFMDFLEDRLLCMPQNQ